MSVRAGTFVALTTAIGTMAGFASAANAATPSSGNASGCYAAPQVPAAPASAAVVAAAAGYKASHDSEAATVRSLTAAGAAHDAQKWALLKSGKLQVRSPKPKTKLAQQANCFQGARSSSAVGYATVSWLSTRLRRAIQGSNPRWWRPASISPVRGDLA